MGNIEVFYMQNGNRTLKHFAINGRDNEKVIASALYEGYKADIGKTTRITEMYADGYSFIHIENGNFMPGVVDTPSVKALNLYEIYMLFEAYKAGTETPVSVPDCYEFLHEPATAGLEAFDVTDEKCFFELKSWDEFRTSVICGHSKYPEKVRQIIKDVYGYSKGHIFFGMAMVGFPKYLQPKGFKSTETGYNVWDVSAEVDGKIVKATLKYAPSKHGGPCKEELAGKLVELYTNSIIKEEFFKFALARKSYKVRCVVELISQYIGHVRYEAHRSTGNWEPYDSFTVDIESVIKTRNAKCRRIGKSEILEVIEFLGDNRDILMELEESSNRSMEHFYPWLIGMLSKNKPLFN